MTTKLFSLTFVVLLAITCAVTAGTFNGTSFSHTSEGFKTGSDTDAGLETLGNDRILRKLNLLALAIDLSDDQKAAIRNIVTENKEELIPLLTALSSHRQKLRNMIRIGDTDETAIQRLLENQVEAKIDLTVIRTKIRREILTVLSDEQRSKARALLTAAFSRSTII